MTIEQIYRDLDKLYAENDIEGLEKYFEEALKELKIDMMSCPSCQQIKAQRLTNMIITVLNEAATFYRGRSSWDKCMYLYEMLLNELAESGQRYSPDYAVAKINQATAYRFKGDLDEARKGFDEAEKLLLECKFEDPYVCAGLYNNRAPVYSELGETKKALEDFTKALEQLRKADGTEQEQSITLASISAMNLMLGENEESEAAIDEAVKIYETAGESPHSGAIFSTKAMLCYDREDYEKAAEMFAKAAEITKKYFGENMEYRICRENEEDARAAAKSR